MMEYDIALKELNICTNTKIITGDLYIKDGQIKHIVKQPNRSSFNAEKSINLSHDFYVIPGMIDIHTHGTAGSDIMDATFKSLDNIANTLPTEGTTSFLATTMTENIDKIENVMINVRDFIESNNNSGAEILGINLEGPFISPKKCGAQNPEKIINPDIELFSKWQHLANNLIKIVTIAPEQPGAIKFIEYLKNNSITASIGHTNATYDETKKAIESGATHATHIFNAMSGINHREPGAATALLLSPKVSTELIADGIHLHPVVIKLIFKIKGEDNIILITDSMRAKCLGDGSYDLGGQIVRVKNNKASLDNGTLAGSMLKMQDAFINMRNFCNIDLLKLIKMTSENPAKLLNIFYRKGSIQEGKDADLVILGKDFNLVMTICKGNIVYSSL